jgi:hypothetical protein
LTKSSLPPERGEQEHASRLPTPTVDDRYARILADDLGCKVSTARTCFIHEPVSRALEVRAWAFKHAPDSPEKRAKLILGWAKRRKAGAFRDQDAEAEKEIARRIAAYWREHPDRLAETLREAMNGAA